MRPSKTTVTSWLVCMSAGLLVVGCVTVKVAEIPPPRHECPSDEDLDRLADWLPALPTDRPPTPIEIEREKRIDEVMERYQNAQAYCTMAEKRLK